MVALIFLCLNLVTSLFKSKSRLEAENPALRRQLIVLQLKLRGRVQFHEQRSLVLDPALSLVPIGPQGHDDRPFRNPCALASGWIFAATGAGNPAPREADRRSINVTAHMSYGPDQIDLFGHSSDYIDRILRGEKPADLPVQAPTK
jgi:hypothetical protein